MRLEAILNTAVDAIITIDERGIMDSVNKAAERLFGYASSEMIGSNVEIGILDNGPGVSPDARERVFDPFYTTKTKGTGLGMAIAQRIVLAHGGRIELGEYDSGAEFFVTIPRRH